MPTYEYECKACGHHFDNFQGINEAHLTTCPECRGDVRRVIGAGAGFIIKGAGSAEASSALSCGHSQPCCGREVRCDKPPCS